MKIAMLLLLAAAAGGAAFAQSGDANDARAPAAKVPPLTYRSAFDEYRPYREQELASWREVNEEVARVGGHAGVVKAGENAAKPQAEKKHGMHR
jgi:hypothetical protein